MDIKKTIAFLQEYDIKNIDPAVVKNQLLKRKDIAAIGVLALLTLIMVSNIAAGHRRRTAQLKQSIAAMTERAAAVREVQTAQKELDALLAKMPDGITEANRMISTLNDLAMARGIQILSFAPGQQNATDLYNATQVRLEVLTGTYADLGLFVTDIERHAPYSFRIDEWSASSTASGTSETQEKINATIQVVSVKVKK